MAAAVQTQLVAALVADVRTDSDLNRSQVYTDDQIATLLSDAGSKLRDIFTQANQLYDVSEFDFTLVGGVGANSVALPDDFQQGHSVDVNPDTAQPYTLRFLSNWLDRNQLNTAPFAIWGAGGGPRSYCFKGTDLVVMPPMSAAGTYRLYYTPLWMPLALPSAVTAQAVNILLVPTTSMGFNASNQFSMDSGPATFLTSDVGNFITVTGATNPSNNGSWTLGTYASATLIGVGGSPASETFPGGATVTLNRSSYVTAAGVWTFYGASEFTQTTGDISVGDTITVTGAANAANNGTFTVTAVGLNTVTTAAAVGLVAENFGIGISVTTQPQGTRADLPKIMNPWVLYLKTVACITIRNKRGQDVGAFEQRLAVEQQRIDAILQVRHDEPEQPPLTRNSGFSGGW